MFRALRRSGECLGGSREPRPVIRFEKPSGGWRPMAKATGFVPAPMATGVASETFDAPQGMQPSFDVIEILPPVAADRLRMLRRHADDLHMLVPEFSQLQG